MPLLHPADRDKRVKLNSDANHTPSDTLTTAETLLALQRDLHLRSSTRARNMLVRCATPGYTKQ